MYGIDMLREGHANLRFEVVQGGIIEGRGGVPAD